MDIIVFIINQPLLKKKNLYSPILKIVGISNYVLI